MKSNTSFNSENYNSLLQAFLETHEGANKLALSNNRLKGLNNWLEGRFKGLEDELLKMETDFDHLKRIYKASSDFDSNKPTNCENCVVLQKKVNYLITIAPKLSMGTANLNAILDLRTVFLKKLALDINVVFKESKRNLAVSLKLMSNNFHLS